MRDTIQLSAGEVLAVEGITVQFGGIRAIDGVGFTVKRGELLGLIGPNGAGKTTMLKTITGLVKPKEGTVRLNGEAVAELAPHRRARAGLALTHQIVRPFRSMSALDNVTLAAGHRKTANVLGALLHLDRRAESARARELLERLGIAQYADAPSGTLPLGVLKRLEVARALAIEPSILLLDEPLAGLNHVEAERLADTVRELNADGMTIVIIEHNLREVQRICQRLVVLDNGRKLAEGLPGEVLANPDVIAAYIGKGGDDARVA